MSLAFIIRILVVRPGVNFCWPAKRAMKSGMYTADCGTQQDTCKVDAGSLWD